MKKTKKRMRRQKHAPKGLAGVGSLKLWPRVPLHILYNQDDWLLGSLVFRLDCCPWHLPRTPHLQDETKHEDARDLPKAGAWAHVQVPDSPAADLDVQESIPAGCLFPVPSCALASSATPKTEITNNSIKDKIAKLSLREKRKLAISKHSNARQSSPQTNGHYSVSFSAQVLRITVITDKEQVKFTPNLHKDVKRNPGTTVVRSSSSGGSSSGSSLYWSYGCSSCCQRYCCTYGRSSSGHSYSSTSGCSFSGHLSSS